MQQVPVFHPTLEEFEMGFSNYVKKITPECVKCGLARIVPPAGWNPREPGWYENLKLTIPSPIHQYISGLKGIYQQTNVMAKKHSLAEFKQAALKYAQARKPCVTDSDVERQFWKMVRFDPAMYGADFSGSLFPDSVKHWNVRDLDGCILKYIGTKLQGVNTPYLYFGMWKSLFGWHTEDMDLFSINFLHFGEPKHWYCIPESHREDFEELAQSYFPDLYNTCEEFLRHKTTMIAPNIILENKIPLFTTVQREGEFMITFPGAYHSGFNHGFNCAESLNFATEYWIPFGIKSSFCQCNKDSVHINMGVFLANYNSCEPVPYEIDDLLLEEEESPAPIPIKLKLVKRRPTQRRRMSTEPKKKQVRAPVKRRPAKKPKSSGKIRIRLHPKPEESEESSEEEYWSDDEELFIDDETDGDWGKRTTSRARSTVQRGQNVAAEVDDYEPVTKAKPSMYERRRKLLMQTKKILQSATMMPKGTMVSAVITHPNNPRLQVEPLGESLLAGLFKSSTGSAPTSGQNDKSNDKDANASVQKTTQQNSDAGLGGCLIRSSFASILAPSSDISDSPSSFVMPSSILLSSLGSFSSK